ncbi:MAG TPA: c-type cytochrome [Saprospiraceae bacterium]|nr:c-type cytochrome [Saprospiraceae bacterium]
MKFKQNIFILVFAMAIFATSCMRDSSKPGREYMPDMGHSIAYEANVYDNYYYNTWDKASEEEGSGKSSFELSVPRLPVKGTIARGYAGGAHPARPSAAGVTVPPNGNVPYYYGDTEPERARAIAEIINNPYPITEKALADGEHLYQIYCGICHGKKADGNGYLVRDDGGKYPSQPPSFINKDFTASSNGRFYHAIMYGKNVMGGYADKLSYEERWNVIHYIRSLQAKNAKLKYNHLRNTLNDSAVPGGSKPAVAMASPNEQSTHEGTMEHQEEGNHDHGDATHQEESDHGHEH